MTHGLGRKTYLPDECPLPPLDVATEADWRGDIERLYRSRANSLIKHFAARTHDAESATDIVHEAFAKLAGIGFAKRLMLVRTDSYLFKICINLLHDRGRAESAHCKIVHCAEPQSIENPFATLEDRDTLRRLEQAMSRLKPKTRAIFLARRIEGLSYAEIAERTGLSVKGVEKQMAKAIATIDRLLDRNVS